MVGGLVFDSEDDDDVKFLSILKHSKTAAPTELLLVSIDVIKVHLFNRTSYFSTEFSEELPSFPPSASKLPSQATTSCVDLKTKQSQPYFKFEKCRNFFVFCSKINIKSNKEITHAIIFEGKYNCWTVLQNN